MPQHLRRAAFLLVAAAAFSASATGSANADQSAYCIHMPATYMSGNPKPTTDDVDLCVPWPGEPI